MGNKVLERGFSKVAKELNLPRSIVEKTYMAYWKVIREHIKAIPMKADMDEETFNSFQPNVNIPSIGKLYVTYDKYMRANNAYKKYKKLKEKENAAH